MYLVKYIFILMLIFVFFYLNQYIDMFTIAYQTYQSFVPINGYKYPINSPFNWFNNFIPINNGYTNLPWWNTSLGNTTNMSYDLRGDPVVIPRTNYVWNNSSIFPIYNSSI